MKKTDRTYTKEEFRVIFERAHELCGALIDELEKEADPGMTAYYVWLNLTHFFASAGLGDNLSYRALDVAKGAAFQAEGTA